MKWIVVIILALFTLNVFSQSERKFVRRGNRLYEDKKFQEADIQYRKALEKSPGSPAAGYNLGNALYRQNQFDAAVQRYKDLAGKQKDIQGKNSDYYNLGNALYKTGKYQECIDAYKNALRKMPGDMDAKHNLQLAMKKLEMQKQQKNQQDQQNKKDKTRITRIKINRTIRRMIINSRTSRINKSSPRKIRKTSKTVSKM